MTYPPDYFERCECGGSDAMHRHGLELGLAAPLDVESLADFIRDKIESEPYQGLHPELASMGLAVAIRDEFLRKTHGIHLFECDKHGRPV